MEITKSKTSPAEAQDGIDDDMVNKDERTDMKRADRQQCGKLSDFGATIAISGVIGDRSLQSPGGVGWNSDKFSAGAAVTGVDASSYCCETPNLKKNNIAESHACPPPPKKRRALNKSHSNGVIKLNFNHCRQEDQHSSTSSPSSSHAPRSPSIIASNGQNAGSNLQRMLQQGFFVPADLQTLPDYIQYLFK